MQSGTPAATPGISVNEHVVSSLTVVQRTVARWMASSACAPRVRVDAPGPRHARVQGVCVGGAGAAGPVPVHPARPQALVLLPQRRVRALPRRAEGGRPSLGASPGVILICVSLNGALCEVAASAGDLSKTKLADRASLNRLACCWSSFCSRAGSRYVDLCDYTPDPQSTIPMLWAEVEELPEPGKQSI